MAASGTPFSHYSQQWLANRHSKLHSWLSATDPFADAGLYDREASPRSRAGSWACDNLRRAPSPAPREASRNEESRS